MRPLLLALPLLALASSPILAAKAPAKPAAKTATTAKKAAAPVKAAPSGPRIAVNADIAKAVADPARTDANRARDKYRHPAQTLSFFGVKPDMTVVEILPGGGWYTEILAPLLAEHGHYVGAPSTGKGTDDFRAFLAKTPDRYARAQVTSFTAGQPTDLVEPGTADMVLTFRNIHNLLGSPEQAGDGNAPQAFADWFRALKPGGILGIEEHRLPETMDSAREKTTGYVKRSTVIRLALTAGFQFAGASEINANPKDDHDHPKGVWTLPPTYDLGDQDKAKYAAIGESDRMTLKFVKPDPNAPADTAQQPSLKVDAAALSDGSSTAPAPDQPHP